MRLSTNLFCVQETPLTTYTVSGGGSMTTWSGTTATYSGQRMREGGREGGRKRGKKGGRKGGRGGVITVVHVKDCSDDYPSPPLPCSTGCFQLESGV